MLKQGRSIQAFTPSDFRRFQMIKSENGISGG